VVSDERWGEDRTHFLVTNAYSEEKSNDLATISKEDVKHLEKLSPAALEFLCEALDIPFHFDTKAAVRDLATVANKGKELITIIPPRQVPKARFQESDLKNKSVEELVDIIKTARWAKVSKSFKKKQLVQTILNAQKSSPPDLEAMMCTLKNQSHQGGAIHHQHYRKTFNTIDLHDRQWNQTQTPHKIKSWEAKLTISLLQTGIINAWSLYRSLNPRTTITYGRFARSLSFSIVKNSHSF